MYPNMTEENFITYEELLAKAKNQKEKVFIKNTIQNEVISNNSCYVDQVFF